MKGALTKSSEKSVHHSIFLYLDIGGLLKGAGGHAGCTPKSAHDEGEASMPNTACLASS